MSQNRAAVHIDAVFDQLGDRLERAALGQCDDGDGIPVIADLEPSACSLSAPTAISAMQTIIARHLSSAPLHVAGEGLA